MDPLASTSRIPRPRPRGSRALRVATHVKAILQKNKELQDHHRLLGVDELSEDDKVTVARARPYRAVPVAEHVHGREVHGRARFDRAGCRRPSRRSSASPRAHYDDVPEQAFYNCGGIDDLERNAHELAKEA